MIGKDFPSGYAREGISHVVTEMVRISGSFKKEHPLTCSV